MSCKGPLEIPAQSSCATIAMLRHCLVMVSQNVQCSHTTALTAERGSLQMANQVRLDRCCEALPEKSRYNVIAYWEL